MKTIIMAGGKGTRIAERFPELPKPLIPIDGIPVLEREIVSLKNQGFTDITMTVSHMHDKIESYFGDGKKWGVHIDYFVETVPLGNAGALFKLGLKEDFLLLNADVVFDVDFNRMAKYHREHGGLATILTHPNNHPYDSGLIIADENGAVSEWLTSSDDRPTYYKNRVNAGIHILSPELFDDENRRSTVGKSVDGKIVKIDLDRDILKPLAGSSRLVCYDSPEYVKDMGTSERLDEVINDYSSGIIAAKNLLNKQKAIFIDRDGTINKYVGFLKDIDQFELIDGVAEAIKKINKSGYLAVVITNQPVIARGDITIEQLNEIHNKMETLLGEKGAYLDGIYFCPHHPDSGYEGEIKELKINCDCRKPKPGLLLKAAAELNISLEDSWMVGDSESDVLAGTMAGCRTILIGLNKYGQDMSINSLREFDINLYRD